MSEPTVTIPFLGAGSGEFEEVQLEVAYLADYPRGADGHCAFCHGDPCAERAGSETTLIGRFYIENQWAETCPMCNGRPS